jgi:hypothetical protein
VRERVRAAPDDEEFLLRVSHLRQRFSRFAAFALRALPLRRSSPIATRYYGYRRPTLNGQMLFSMFPEDMPLRVMAKSEWWSDSFVADYGREYDFSRPFLDQMLS